MDAGPRAPATGARPFGPAPSRWPGRLRLVEQSVGDEPFCPYLSPVSQDHLPLPHMRVLAALACAVSASACSIAPQLSPRAMGCYAVELDSFPAAFSQRLVPPPPDLVRLDTINGGQLEVPTPWLERQGLNARSAILRQTRPEWRIRNGQVQPEREAFSPLPPDSLVLIFSGRGASLTAALGADGNGQWKGWAFSSVNFTPNAEPLVPMRLLRRDCGLTPLGISR